MTSDGHPSGLTSLHYLHAMQPRREFGKRPFFRENRLSSQANRTEDGGDDDATFAPERRALPHLTTSPASRAPSREEEAVEERRQQARRVAITAEEKGREFFLPTLFLKLTLSGTRELEKNRNWP